MSDTALAKPDEYAIAAAGADVGAMLERNLGGEKLSVFDLRRVKVPVGGSMTWIVPGLHGEEAMKEIVGVIVFHKNTRAYWKERIEDSSGSRPPDCWSDDGLHGVGVMANEIEDGLCEKCPLGNFGGACSPSRQIFIMQKDDRLPLLIIVPRGSLKTAKAYIARLINMGINYENCVTRIGLKKEKSVDGFDYAQMTFDTVDVMTPDTAKTFSAIRDSLEPKLKRVGATG